VTPPSRPGGRQGFLDDVIVELGYARRETVEWAVEHGRHLGGSVGTVLVESGILTEDQLSRAIAELHGLEHVDLAEFEIDLEVARLISRQAARRYHAVPIGFDSEGSLIVALADPVDPLAVSDVAVMTRSEVHPMVAAESPIDAVIAELDDAPGFAPSPVPQPAEVSDPRELPQPDYGPVVPPGAQPVNGEVAEELARVGAALAEMSERLAAAEQANRRLEDRLARIFEHASEPPR
jgi:hypothetical protein